MLKKVTRFREYSRLASIAAKVRLKIVQSVYMFNGKTSLANVRFKNGLISSNSYLFVICRKTYTGSEDYFHERKYLVGNEYGVIRLERGSYHYAFESYLPPQLPTSIEGNFGYIRYKVCVVVDTASQPNEEFEVPFTVIKAINLNQSPSLRDPVVDEESKTFFKCFLLCCFQSNPLNIVARIPFGGYVGGQTINVEFSADNKSDQNVSEFTVQLVKEIAYYENANRAHNKIERIVITETRTNGCDINDLQMYRVNLKVPSIPPSDATSTIVKVRYCCRVIGSVAAFHSNPVVELPIVIGTYPLFDEPAPSMQNAMMQKQIITNITPSAPPQSNDPPTYEAAMQFGGQTERNFNPNYPMYQPQPGFLNQI